jgi:CubicO group peptidase (beta-lactamase class C family)
VFAETRRAYSFFGTTDINLLFLGALLAQLGHEYPNECSRYEADLEVCATDIDTTLQRGVLGPFGMSSSTYLWNDHLARHAVSPHDSDGKPFAKRHPTASDAARYASAGGLHTTPTDYTAFLLEIINPKPPDLFRLTKASLEEMVRPQVKFPKNMQIDGATSWALGWAVQERTTGNVIVHSGGQAGFQSLTMVSMPRKSGYIILTNSNNGWKVFHHPEFVKAMDELLDGGVG